MYPLTQVIFTCIFQVRMFTVVIEHVLFDHDLEVIGLKHAHTTQSGQPLYAIFKNGVAYRFAPGHCLKYEALSNPLIIRYSENTNTLKGPLLFPKESEATN